MGHFIPNWVQKLVCIVLGIPFENFSEILHDDRTLLANGSDYSKYLNKLLLLPIQFFFHLSFIKITSVGLEAKY